MCAQDIPCEAAETQLSTVSVTRSNKARNSAESLRTSLSTAMHGLLNVALVLCSFACGACDMPAPADTHAAAQLHQSLAEPFEHKKQFLSEVR